MDLSSRDVFLLTLVARFAVVIFMPFAITYPVLMLYQLHFLIRVSIFLIGYFLLTKVLHHFFWSELCFESGIKSHLVECLSKINRRINRYVIYPWRRGFKCRSYTILKILKRHGKWGEHQIITEEIIREFKRIISTHLDGSLYIILSPRRFSFPQQ